MKHLSIVLTGLLLLAGAGCSSATPAAAPAPAAQPQAAAPTATSDAHLSFVRGSLGSAGITAYTESDEASDVAKMASKNSISAATKFKFSGGNGSVRLLVVAVKSPAELAAVKAEIEAQYAQLLQISTSARVNWLAGDTNHVSVVTFKAGDEEFAGKVVTALGGTLAAAPAPAPAAAVTQEVGFKVGDKVIADWKGGDMWWDAVVTGVAGNKISVKYTSDNSLDTLNISAVAHLNQPNTELKAGDKVVAKWNGGSYYNATVVSVSDSKVKLRWSDKSVTEVPFSAVEMPGK